MVSAINPTQKSGVSGDGREQLIELLGLSCNLNDQLVPTNIEDFQSDWTFTVDALMRLLDAQYNAALAAAEGVLETKIIDGGSGGLWPGEHKVNETIDAARQQIQALRRGKS